MVYECTCEKKRKIENLDQLVKHVQFQHFSEDDDGKITFLCPDLECTEPTFTGFQNIKRHFTTHHRFDKKFDFLYNEFMQNQIDHQPNGQDDDSSSDDSSGSSAASARIGDIVDFDDLDDNGGHNNDHEMQEFSFPILVNTKTLEPLDLEDKLCELIVNHKKKFQATEAGIMSMSKDYLAYFINYLEERDIDASELQELSNNVKSFYKVQKNLEARKEVVFKRESVIENEVEYDFYYIPIESTLRLVLQNETAMKYIYEWNQRPPSETEYTDFKDGQCFKEIQLKRQFNDKDIVIFIQLYFDDFCLTTNPNTKMSVVYFTVANLPPFLSSSRDQIYLLYIAKRKFLDVIHFEGLFETLFKDFERLLYCPIELSNNFVVCLEFEVCVADNSGNSELMEITRNYKQDACLVCPIHYDELQIFFEEDKYEDHKVKVNSVRECPKDNTFKDQVQENFFYAPDLFHDFTSQGIIQRVLGSLMRVFYQDFLINRKKRNLVKFNLIKKEMLNKLNAIEHRNGSINDINKDHAFISGTGSQQIDFFLLFGYLDTTIDRNCEMWKIYKLIREIYLFFDSESMRRDELDDMQSKVDEFNKLFYTLFTKEGISTFTIKLHHPTHYVKWVKKIGPIKRYSTIKYERRHQPLKRSEFLSLQFKNKPMSIAKWYALTMEVDFNLEEFVLKKQLKIEDFDKQKLKRFSNFFDFENGNEIYSLKSLSIKKVPLNKGNFFRMKVREENSPLPKFVEIVFVCKQNDEFIIIGSIFTSLSYDESKFCFKVKNTNELIKLDPDLIHYHQMTFIREDDFILQDFKM